MRFELNHGQFDRRVHFLARGAGYTFFLTGSDAVLTVAAWRHPTATTNRVHGKGLHASVQVVPGRIQPKIVSESTLRLHVEGANPHPQVVGLDQLPGVANYFLSNDPHTWRSNVPSYARVMYRNIYPGVNLVYYGHQGTLEYDWQVQPGANPRAIALTIEGAQALHLDSQGNLVLQTAQGAITQQAPIVYQDVAGQRRVIATRYLLTGPHRIGFAVGSYNPKHALIIDPVLSFSTYLGGTGDDSGYSIAVDSTGDTYIVGGTTSTDFPIATGIQGSYGGGVTCPYLCGDVFVTKVNAAGTALVYSTYLGGDSYDLGNGVAVDAAGNVYVTGYTASDNFPTANALQPTCGCSSYSGDAFVTEINAAGSALVYSTYLGGSGEDHGSGIAVDAAGNAYVAGETYSTNFPTVNPIQPHCGDTSGCNNGDVFVAKINTAGSAPVYSTYLGGNGVDSLAGEWSRGDYNNGIAVDAAGNTYVTGETTSTNFPTVNALHPSCGDTSGCDDAFVAKINAAGSALVYSTYLGGSDIDYGAGIAVDAAGSAYVTGGTYSTDFPTANALQPYCSCSGTAFVTKINPTGSALVYSTYLGGTRFDFGNGIAVNAAGNAYVTGGTYSTDFPTVNPIQAHCGDPSRCNNGDVFVTELTGLGTGVVFSTYLGGGQLDYGTDIAVDSVGNAYITGETDSANFPTQSPLQAALSGSSDAFISKINPYVGPSNSASNSPSGIQQPPCTGDPINCATGDFSDSFTDFAVPGRGLPLTFARTYDALNASHDGPLGFGWTDNYNMSLTTDASGTITVTEEGGSMIAFTLSGSTYTPPSWVLASLVKNGDGTITFTRRDQDKFTFTVPATSTVGQLIKEQDRNGYATTLSYNGNGQLATVTDPAGRSLTFNYNAAGRIASISDPISRTVAFTYDAAGNLTAVQDVMGSLTQFTYDSSGNHLLRTITDPRGSVVSNVYDSAGRVISQTNALSRTTSLSYAANNDGTQTTTITNARGIVTLERFESNMLISRTIGFGTPQTATWLYTYDPATLGTASVTDPNGHTSSSTYDAHGNLLSQTDALGRTTRYQYDTLDDTTAITDPLSVTTVMTYDASGNLLQVARPLTQTGQVISATLTYDSLHPGDVLTGTDPNGHVTSYSYDSDGDVASSSDPLSETSTFSYDGIGRLIAVVAPRGNVAGANPISYTTTITYDAFGDTTAITDALEHSTTYQYDADRNALAATDALGRTTRQAYDLANEPTSTTLADGGTWLTGYDATGNVVTTTDALGHVTTYGYDALDRRTRLTDALTHTTTMAYDPAGNVITATDPLSHITTYGYDAANELTSMTRPDGGVFRTAYDLDGRPITQADALANSTTFAYDSLNRLIAQTDPLSRTTHYGYDLAGNRVSLTDPLGRTTSYTYDLADRPIATLRPDTSLVRSGYDPNGNVITTTDPLSHTTTYDYDVLDRQVSTTDPLAHTTVYSYDSVGNRTAITDPLSHTTSYGYDALNRVITTTDPLSQTTVTGYDLVGNIITSTDALNHTTTYGYDAANERTSITQPDGSVLRAAYDTDGNVITSTDALNRPTTYGYDALNRVISYTDPLTRTTVYTYDVVDNRVALTDALSRTTLYGFDADHETTAITYNSTTTPNVTFTYTASGQRASMSDGTGTSTYGYDALDRLITTTTGAGQSLGYGYDPAGRLTTLDYPSAGQVVTHTYDAADQLVKETYPTTLAASNAILTLDATGAITKLVDALPGGAFWTYTYGRDALGQLNSGFVVADGSAHTYSYDSHNRLSTDSRTKGGTTVTSWGMDAADEITQSATGAATSTLSYDGAGELTSLRTTSGLSTTQNIGYTYNVDGDRSGQHDSVSGASSSYGYDQADRLISATVGLSPTTYTYTYDGDGLRQGKTVGGTTTTETWDTAEGLPLLVQDGTTRYVTGPDGRVVEQILANGTVRYVLQDQLGSTAGVLDAGGRIAGMAAYDAYGAQHVSSGTIPMPFGYAGQYTDAETGFQYLQARSYDPVTMQFLSVDPLVAQTGQPYSYADDNPINAVDPTGLLGSCPGLDIPSPIGNHACTGPLSAATLWVASHFPSQAHQIAVQARQANKHATQWVQTTPTGRLFDSMVIQPVCTLQDPNADWHAKARAAVDLGMLAGGPELGETGALGDAADVATSGDAAGAEVEQYVNLASEARTEHILSGDATGGGHLWPGLPGKTHSQRIGQRQRLCTRSPTWRPIQPQPS